MKVLVCGGGPAGLTTALLLRRNDPRRDVVVLERGDSDANVGWGLTFPLQTFANVDPCLDLPATVVKGPPRIVYQGETLASAEQLRFETISRTVLIRALRQRCAAVGVRLEYGVALDSIEDSRLADCDLVVIADGAASGLRSALDLGTSVLLGENRFVWLATPRLFEHLSLLVQDSAEGAYLAWAYAYSPQLSTFIIECSEPTWVAAEMMRRTPDDTCQLLAARFRDALAGEPLLHGGALRWRQFPVVRNRAWSRGNVVLVGDAAHTAHYSTGAGTSEAIRDAVCLSEALDREPIAAALESYQRIRQPEVLLVQRTATEWMMLCEQILEVADAGAAAAVRRLLERCGSPA